MEKKELIGRKVKGFAFDNQTDGVPYIISMDRLIGVVGIIEEIQPSEVLVNFGYDDALYPASLIEQHLVSDNKHDMELLDKFALVALPALIRESSVNATEEQIASATYGIAKAMLDERRKYEND